jgi:outer membrane protein assembly factor BamD (BamD/ComL family)
LTEKAKKAGESLSKFESQHHNSPTTDRQIALAKAFKHANHKGS